MTATVELLRHRWDESDPADTLGLDSRAIGRIALDIGTVRRPGLMPDPIGTLYVATTSHEGSEREPAHLPAFRVTGTLAASLAGVVVAATIGTYRTADGALVPFRVERARYHRPGSEPWQPDDATPRAADVASAALWLIADRFNRTGDRAAWHAQLVSMADTQALVDRRYALAYAADRARLDLAHKLDALATFDATHPTIAQARQARP